MLFKMTDIETSISPKNINIGDIGYHLYTKDENTAFIRIGINQYGERIDLNAIDMTPRLDLLMQDGTYSVTLTPTKISWKEDQSFLINFNPSAISLSGKQVVKLEANGKTLKNASSTQDGYFFWYTVPTYDSLSSFNRTSEVKDFVGSLTLDTTESDGKKVYKNIEMKITYK